MHSTADLVRDALSLTGSKVLPPQGSAGTCRSPTGLEIRGVAVGCRSAFRSFSRCRLSLHVVDACTQRHVHLCFAALRSNRRENAKEWDGEILSEVQSVNDCGDSIGTSRPRVRALIWLERRTVVNVPVLFAVCRVQDDSTAHATASIRPCRGGRVVVL